jgi:hypothetical protein
VDLASEQAKICFSGGYFQVSLVCADCCNFPGPLELTAHSLPAGCNANFSGRWNALIGCAAPNCRLGLSFTPPGRLMPSPLVCPLSEHGFP